VVTGLNIPFLISHNCLIIAADNKTYAEIFTTTSTTTTTTIAPLETTLDIVSSQDDVSDDEVIENPRAFSQIFQHFIGKILKYC